MKKADMKTSARRETLKRLLSYLRRSLPALVLTILFAVLTVALSLWIPILCGRAVDCMAEEGGVDFRGIADNLVKIGAAAALCAATPSPP